MHLHFILLRHLRPTTHHHHHFTTTSSVIPSINWVRDRALDHAVEKERHLIPLTNLINLILHQPSKTLPLSIITHNRSSLSIPSRPIDFIRKYPSVFHEFLPAGINIIHPHVKLTDQTLLLDAQQQIVFNSDAFKLDVANRLLKLLMLGRVNRIPLSVIDRFKWDLGLPHDYVDSVVPHFPHYFRVVNSNSNSKSPINSNVDGLELELELVCWNDEMAVSDMELKGLNEFKLQYSRGFEVDKKYKKWVDEWQKLPYVSPYENVMSLEGKGEGTDKWIVGLMHEVLNILVPKKTEKDNLLCFGEYLGVRSRFKKALLEHPGIFYVSSKLRTHTVVLREGYKRDLLVEKVRHPVMKMRSSYVHLMNMVKEKSKSKDAEGGEKKPKETCDLDGEDDELSDDVSEEGEDDETEGVISDDDSESEDLEVVPRTPKKKANLEGRKNSDMRSKTRRSDDNSESEDLEEMQRTPTKKTNLEGRKNSDQRSRRCGRYDNGESEDLEEIQRIPTKRTNFKGRKVSVQRDRTRRSNNNGESEDLDNGNTKIRAGRFNDSNRRNSSNSRVNDNDGRRGRGNDRKYAFDERSYSRTNRMSDRRVAKETTTLRTEAPRGRASRDRSSEGPNFSRTGEGRSSARSGFSRTREARPSDRSGVSRTREGRPSERSHASRTREGRSSERSRVSRTREGGL